MTIQYFVITVFSSEGVESLGSAENGTLIKYWKIKTSRNPEKHQRVCNSYYVRNYDFRDLCTVARINDHRN